VYAAFQANKVVHISSSGARELTDVQSGVVPADDVRVSGVELSVTRFHQFVMVVLQDVPDIDPVCHYLVSTTNSRLYLFPESPKRRSRDIGQSINQSIKSNQNQIRFISGNMAHKSYKLVQKQRQIEKERNKNIQHTTHSTY